MRTLSDEVYSIVSDAIEEILERTEGHKSARKHLVEGVCHSCVVALTNIKYKKNEKIASVKKQADFYVNDINKAIEDFSHCTRE